jgi:hypothetical protein
MGVKVIDKAGQKEVDVSSSDAQQAVLDGRAVLPDGKVRVRDGNRTGTVDASKLGEALAEGWQLADEEEVAQATIRREESDLASTLGGVLESGLAGATLGGSTWLEANVLGMDPERMRARREMAGSLSTAAELAGALAPALVTGGGSAAVQGGARAGLATRAALATPAGAMARAGAGIERGLVGALGEAPALVRTVVPVAGRGAVEGFAAGVGAEIDDAVLGERELVAENLLSAGGMGALFGGGAGALVPGMAAAGAGLTKVPAKYAREIMGKVSGSADDAGSSLWSRAVTDDNVAKWAHLNNLDPEDAALIKRKLDTPEGAKELERYLNDDRGVTEEIAGSMRTPFEALRTARAKVRQEFGGAQKIRHVEQNLPRETDRLVTAHERSVGLLDELEGSLSNTSALANRADIEDIRKMISEARIEIGAAARNASGKSGARITAAATHRALDKVKQGVFSVKDGYRRIVNSGAPTREAQVMTELLEGTSGRKGFYDRVRSHLEDEQLWGEAGAVQQAMNTRAAASINARRGLKGTASGRILDPTRPVIDNADLLSVTRQSGGRFAGATKTELLEEAVAAESAYFDEALKRLDLSPETRAAIAEYKAAAGQIDEAFNAQKEKVRTLDATERFRVSEGNRSPSITGASTVGAEVARGAGTSVGAALGSFLGPVGTLAGAALGRGLGEVASLATRPYTLVRKLAAIRARSGGAKDAQTAAMGGFLKQIGEGTAGAAKLLAGTAGRATRGAAPAAAAVGTRNDRIAASRARALDLARTLPLVDDEIRKMTIDMDEVAPNVAGVVASKTHKAVQFLASKAPPVYQTAYSTRPPLIDPVAAAEFERYVEACEDPMRTLSQLEAGTFTMEHAETLRTVWPAVYRTAQQQCIDALATAHENGVSVPLATLTQMSVLFDVGADPTLDMAPAIAAALSAPAPPPSPSGGAPQPSRPSAKVEIDTDRVASTSSGIGTME